MGGPPLRQSGETSLIDSLKQTLLKIDALADDILPVKTAL
jgi:hypothetical protein